MGNTLTLERKLSPNHDADPTQTMLGYLAFALHGIAAGHVLETLGDISELPLKQREALCLTAARELVHQLQSSLVAAPQSPITSEILEQLSQAGAFTNEQIKSRFPPDETEERKLAGLISAVRTNIKTGKRG